MQLLWKIFNLATTEWLVRKELEGEPDIIIPHFAAKLSNLLQQTTVQDALVVTAMV